MNKNHSIYITLAFMLLIASCDKPQSDDGGAKPEPVVDGDDGGGTENGGTDPEAKAEVKPEVKPSFSFLQASDRIALTVTSYTQKVTEANKPTDDTRKTAYSSSNDDIATVDDKGVVTFKTAGTVTIKAEKQKKGEHLLRSAQYTLYITVKPTNKAALIAEIKRATKAHGNKVDLNYIDTSVITNMSNMFATNDGYKLEKFNGDISKWDVSQVTDMSSMFANATAFNGDISEWNVSQVTTMHYMFYKATAFNGAISKWNVSQVTTMVAMFYNATVFNQDISAWNVSQVTNMSYMFNRTTAFNQDISEWNVSQVTNMYSMFYRATAFNQDISAWDVSQVTDMDGMFEDATAFTQNLESWGEKLHATIANDMGNADDMFQNSGVAASVPAWCTGDCDHTSTR